MFKPSTFLLVLLAIFSATAGSRSFATEGEPQIAPKNAGNAAKAELARMDAEKLAKQTEIEKLNKKKSEFNDENDPGGVERKKIDEQIKPLQERIAELDRQRPFTQEAADAADKAAQAAAKPGSEDKGGGMPPPGQPPPPADKKKDDSSPTPSPTPKPDASPTPSATPTPSPSTKNPEVVNLAHEPVAEPTPTTNPATQAQLDGYEKQKNDALASLDEAKKLNSTPVVRETPAGQSAQNGNLGFGSVMEDQHLGASVQAGETAMGTHGATGNTPQNAAAGNHFTGGSLEPAGQNVTGSGNAVNAGNTAGHNFMSPEQSASLSEVPKGVKASPELYGAAKGVMAAPTIRESYWNPQPVSKQLAAALEAENAHVIGSTPSSHQTTPVPALNQAKPVTGSTGF